MMVATGARDRHASLWSPSRGWGCWAVKLASVLLGARAVLYHRPAVSPACAEDSAYEGWGSGFGWTRHSQAEDTAMKQTGGAPFLPTPRTQESHIKRPESSCLCFTLQTWKVSRSSWHHGPRAFRPHPQEDASWIFFSQHKRESEFCVQKFAIRHLAQEAPPAPLSAAKIPSGARSVASA